MAALVAWGSGSGGTGPGGSTTERNVRATFFVTGDFARRYPAQVRAMSAGGHVIGNHSDTHPDFTTLSTIAQREQLARAEATIRELTGATTRPWFRFPFGASSVSAVDTVNGAGYACIGWTVDTLGWKGTSGGQSVDSVVSRVLSSARPGQIVLMHVGANPDDGSTLDADALPRIIDGLRSQGYRFIALAYPVR
jgi:peptidoglycan/xylan/chitin deacetylase (PgdA/CDA1 family)